MKKLQAVLITIACVWAGQTLAVETSTISLRCTSQRVDLQEGVTGSILCPKLDRTLGRTITSGSLMLLAPISEWVTVTNYGQQAKTITVRDEARILIDSLQGFSFAVPVFTSENRGTLNLEPGETESYFGAGSGSATSYQSDPGRLLSYVGDPGDTFEVRFRAQPFVTVFSGNFELLLDYRGEVNMQGYVVYSYVPVPEPSTSAMMMLSLVLLSFGRFVSHRRRCFGCILSGPPAGVPS